MADRTKRQEGAGRRSRRFITTVLSLLPLLSGVGVLAPGFVRVLAQVDEEAEGDGRPVFDFAKGALQGHQPMLPVPRDFSAGFLPELMDLENLFSRSEYDGSDAARRYFARLLGFPRSHGDTIVLDDVDRKTSPIVFKDPIVMGQLLASTLPPPAPGLNPLADPVPRGDGLRYDDPFGPFIDEDDTNVIPEPGSGFLFGAGLFLMGLRRRSR